MFHPYIATSGINGSYKIKMIGSIFRSILINTTDCQFMLFIQGQFLSHRVLPTKSITNKSFRNKYTPRPL